MLNRVAFACLWLFVFSMPMEKAIQIPGLGTISKLAGLLAMAAGLFALVVNGRFRLPAGIHIALALLILWSAITFRWSMSEEATLERTVTYTQLLCLVLLVWQFCPEERHVLGLLRAYVLGTLVTAGDTVQRFLVGHQTFYNRYATAGFDPNDLALTLALALPMSYYLVLRGSGPFRWIYAGQMAAAMGTIFLTASRGGTFCMAIGLSLIAWTLGTLPVRGRIGVIAAGLVAMAAALVLVPATTWSRLGTVASEVSEGTLNSRTILWKAGLNEFEKQPFGGVGAGAYPETSAKLIGRPWAFVAVAHNSFISVLVETGVVGFLIFAAMLGLLFRSVLRMHGITRTFWLTTFAVWMVGVCSLTWEYRKPTWLLFGLIAAHAASRRQVTGNAAHATVRRSRYVSIAEAYS